MKCVIAGSRNVTDLSLVERAVEASGFEITEVVSGTARGVDRLGEEWARKNGIPVRQFPAQWDVYGKSAGHIRNDEMAQYSGCGVIVWDGVSKGTKSMITELFRYRKPFVCLISSGKASTWLYEMCRLHSDVNTKVIHVSC